jgi:hypothetical protein
MAIQAPTFQKDAVPSLKGWHHPKTNELLKATRHSQDQLDEFFGVVVEKPTPAPTPAVEPIAEDVAVPEDFASMSKVELEGLAREHGLELDRRLSKKKLLDQVASLVKR